MTQAEAVRRLRGFTGEWDTNNLPDGTGGTYLGALDFLQMGAEQANDDLEYFFKDTTLTVTSQETSLATDLIRMVFVTLDGVRLTPATIDDLNHEFPDWHNEPAGKPTHWYYYSKIGLYPAPSTDFLSAAGVVYSMRHTATPTISSSPGFDLLATQHHRIPIYYAAALWFEANGLDGDGWRAERFMRLYERAVAVVKPYYRDRLERRG